MPSGAASTTVRQAAADQLFMTPCLPDRKSTRLNSSHGYISYAVFCLKKQHHDLGRSVKPEIIDPQTKTTWERTWFVLVKESQDIASPPRSSYIGVGFFLARTVLAVFA